MESLYDKIGGQETVDKLVEAFYPLVYAEPELAPLFAGDIEEIKRKQKMFLPQFLGGPAFYSEEFGPPAMQHRHMPFPITPSRAKKWLHCMSKAMDTIGLAGVEREMFFSRLTQVASIMVNTPEDSPHPF